MKKGYGILVDGELLAVAVGTKKEGMDLLKIIKQNNPGLDTTKVKLVRVTITKE
jgi:hypothetical protein